LLLRPWTWFVWQAERSGKQPAALPPTALPGTEDDVVDDYERSRKEVDDEMEGYEVIWMVWWQEYIDW